MHDLDTINAMNNPFEPISDEDVNEIITLWDADVTGIRSWIDERVYKLAVELKFRRAEMRRHRNKWEGKK